MDHPSFTFRLERVRTLRERAEEQAREALARELSERVRGEALLRAAEQGVASARDTGRSAASRAASGADLLAAQAWMERAERISREAALDLDRQDAEVAARRATLAHASREREVIEQLKRRQRAAHEREAERRSQLALDEIALAVHRRAHAGEAA